MCIYIYSIRKLCLLFFKNNLLTQILLEFTLFWKINLKLINYFEINKEKERNLPYVAKKPFVSLLTNILALIPT